MGPKTYSGLYILITLLGILLLDNETLKKSSNKKKFLIKFVIFMIFQIPLIILVLIDYTSEKGYTLYKLFNYYDLKYGDKLDFVYHIKTRYRDDSTAKTPKCKIEGEISSNTLKINKMTDCDKNEDTKDSYLKLLTHTGKFDDGDKIKVGSEIKDFTWK